MTPQEIIDHIRNSPNDNAAELMPEITAFWLREVALQFAIHNEREQLKMAELDSIQEKLKALVGQGVPSA